MEVFISWSGLRSERVAVALRDWLPSVIQSVNPFMSASDIEKGSRWPDVLATHLNDAQFGLICLTQENLEAPWLLFEAGALSKSIENSRVVPYLYGVSQAQLQGPLAQFQAAVADQSSTLGILKSINETLGGNALDQARLESAFETWWPQLARMLEDIPEATEEAPPSRADRDILEEILRLSRQMSRQSALNVELDQGTLRNILVHGALTEPVDPAEGLVAEDLRLLFNDPTRRQIDLNRLELMRVARERAQILRRSRERLADAQPSSESDLQSGNDTDEEV